MSSALPSLPPELDAAARTAFGYLSATDPLPAIAADAVIGFGVFDLSLASFCGDLHDRGLVPRLLFTGGIGAGTADLGRPEAEAWRDELLRTHPHFPPAHVIVETRSTNTAENIAFTAELLAREHPALAFGRGLYTALIVAAPSRLRRVKLTLARLQPALHAVRCLPPPDFDRERALYESKGIPFLSHLRGELDRLVSYPARGWIAAEPLPAVVATAHARLQAAP